MPRLGELLVAAGLLTVEQVEQALRAQVMWGGRLGTNLIELHYLELDPLSKVLGQQYRLPAALARHFEKADPALQRLLPPELAEQFSCVPLLRMGPEQHVVVASPSPLPPRQLAVIAAALAVDVKQLVPAIAAELRIRYQLERVYGIRRAARFLRARGNSIPPFPNFQVLPVPSDGEFDLPAPVLPISTREIASYRPLRLDAPIRSSTSLKAGEVAAPNTSGIEALAQHDALEDDLAIPTAPIEDEASARQRRKYVQTIADMPENDPAQQSSIARVAIRRVSSARLMGGATLGEATRAIRRSTGRDRVADLVIDTLDRFAPTCEAAILLVVRGATAIGWKGFQRTGSLHGEIAVPLEDGGLVPRTIELKITQRKRFDELAMIDRLLLASLGQQAGDLVVVPIAIADKVMCVIAIATAEDAPIANAEPIATAAGAAFVRLIRDASR
jgi:hypothetical protein